MADSFVAMRVTTTTYKGRCTQCRHLARHHRVGGWWRGGGRKHLSFCTLGCAKHGCEGVAPGVAIVARIKDPDRDRSPTSVLLRRLFGLTLGEAKAVLAVARTQSQKEAAREAGVARTTLRTQIHHAYEKLGLHDRADLLRLLAGYGFG